MAGKVPQLLLRILLLTLIAVSGWDTIVYLGYHLEWVLDLRTASTGVFHVSLLLALGTAVLLVVRWPSENAGRLIAAFIVFFSAAWSVRVLGLVMDPQGSTLARLTEALGLGPSVGETLGYASFWLSLAAFVRFTAVFPEPLTAEDAPTLRGGKSSGVFGRWARADSGIAAQRAANAFFTLPFRPAAVWLSATAVGVVTSPVIHLGGDPGLWVWADVGLWVAFFTFLILNLETSYKKGSFRDPRMLWVWAGIAVTAFVLTSGAFLLLFSESLQTELFAMGDLHPTHDTYVVLPVIISPAIPFIIAAVLIATFYAGRFDPELVIRKTTVVGILAVIGIFVFGAVESLVSDYVSLQVGLPEDMGSWVAGGSAAIVITVVRNHARRWSGSMLPKEPDSEDSTEAADPNSSA